MELNSVLEIVKEIAHTTVVQEAPSSDEKGEWVSKSMEALKDSKITGLVVPVESGGMGLGLSALVQVCETLGTYYASAGLCFGMHCVGSAVLAAKATKWQKENYLEPIAAGKHITTLALSEPGTGAHFYFPQTKLITDDSGFLVNGEKTFVTNGGHADSYVISTLGIDNISSSEGFTCAIMDADSKGISWGDKWNGIGMRGNSSRGMKLENVSIRNEHVLGEKGDQLWYVFNVVAPYFLTAMAGTYLGVAQAAFNEARTCLKDRVYSHNGSHLSQVSVMQHKLGYMYEKLEAAKALIHHAARQGDEGTVEALTLILSSKSVAAACAVEMANEAMTIAGGRGYRNNSLLERLLRDARAAHVMSPTTDLLYTWIGRALLDEPLLSD